MLLAAALACSQQKEPQQDPNVIATVNGEVVARLEFEQELGREALSMEDLGTRTPEQIEPFKQTLLDTLVERLLLLQAARTAGVAATSEEVDRRLLALASEFPAGSFDDALAQSHTTRTELRKKTRDQLTIEKLFQEQVFSRVAVTEEQLRRYFDEHPDDFAEPERVHAQQIVVSGLDEAKRLQQQLYAGKKFSDLARKFSLSPDAKVGGDLGFFRRGEMPPAFDEVVFKLGPGSVSEVVSTDYGFHLFKVLEKKPARKKELAEVRADIEKKLLAQLRAERQRDYVKALRARADVKVNDQALQSVVVRPTTRPPEEP